MIEPKLEVPAELRDLAEKTIDQAEKAFGMFFEAATKSMTNVPGAGADVSKQALAFTEQNMKSAFEHARKLVHATDLQEAMRIQHGSARPDLVRKIDSLRATEPRRGDGDSDHERSPERIEGRRRQRGKEGSAAPAVHSGSS